jgi:hypothetical protein
MIAAPAADGSVCYAVEPSGGGGCTTRVGPGGDINIDLESPGGGAVYGLTQNGVIAVDLYVRGRRWRVRLGENAFYYGFRNRSAAPTRIVFRQVDGLPVSYGLPRG